MIYGGPNKPISHAYRTSTKVSSPTSSNNTLKVRNKGKRDNKDNKWSLWNLSVSYQLPAKVVHLNFPQLRKTDYTDRTVHLLHCFTVHVCVSAVTNGYISRHGSSHPLGEHQRVRGNSIHLLSPFLDSSCDGARAVLVFMWVYFLYVSEPKRSHKEPLSSSQR